MSASLPVSIALWSAAVTIGLIVALALGGQIAWQIRTPPEERRPFDPIGAAIGLSLVLAVPATFAVFCASLGSALLIAIGAPPLVYPFVLLAALMGLRSASKSPGGGMEGCTKAIGLFAASYVAVWSVVSLWLLGGFGRLAVAIESLAFLQPPLVALPFAITLWRIAGRKRQARLFWGAWVILSAYAALCFLPVQRGAVGAWLPASDWLRFPLAGAPAFAATVTLLALPTLSSAHPSRRKAERRGTANNALLGAFLGVLAGLAWAASGVGLALV